MKVFATYKSRTTQVVHETNADGVRTTNIRTFEGFIAVETKEAAHGVRPAEMSDIVHAIEKSVRHGQEQLKQSTPDVSYEFESDICIESLALVSIAGNY